ncbi:MAG: hypothetical protein H6828_13535 [Planctomycetes bacterium]|nr:hypothetical protein [Planctomycetota bacterium]
MTPLARILSRRRTIYLVLLLVCAGLSLRPVPAVERGLDVLFAPTRALAVLVAPLRWLRMPKVHAAERDLYARAEEGRSGAVELLAAEQRAALPSPALRQGRRLVHGEVIRRSRGHLDRVEVRVADRTGLAAGMPVVTGDAYVGRVAALDREDAALVLVELVTGSDFYVGAEVFDDAARDALIGRPVIVGGLAAELPDSEHELHLAVHDPSRRGARAGRVVVRELEAYGEAYAHLADGFSLGRMETVPRKRAELTRIVPELDFKSGLFQVVVLAPDEDAGPGEEALELDTFVAASWVRVQGLTRGDITPAREGRLLSGGLVAGVSEGSAVAFGAHLVGRVGEVGWTTADLRGLGDPGLRLAALAQVDGDPVPRALGELVALGRDRDDGSLRFRWTARVELEGGGPERVGALLFTGSGEEGVPRGLVIGRAELPTTRGVHELRVVQDPEVRELDQLYVWRGHGVAEAAR